MDLYTDRLIFGKKTLNASRPRLDRFVAPRESFPEMQRRFVWSTRARCKQRHDNFWDSQYVHRKHYIGHLDEAFGLVEPSGVKEYERYPSCWPCIPRKQSFLSSADSILDLPSYSFADYLLDWSNENILVAALGRMYHKWSWKTQDLAGEGFTNQVIYCCKFDPSGKLLALGTNMKTVEIHDSTLSKCVSSAICPCPHTYCSITSVDWSPTGNSLVSGCSRGTLVSRTRTARSIKSHHTYDVAILVARVSPNARYLAAAAVNAKSLVLLNWPSLMVFSSINLGGIIQALTWHPWRSALLAVGTETQLQTHLCMWDVPSDRLSENELGRAPQYLEAMLFSHRTGELVLSSNLRDRANPHNACTKLVVMSDTNTIVDQWGDRRGGLDRVRTMIFNPDGTKLATATAHEDLIIWNFLPDDYKKNKKNKRFSDLPVCLDKATYGVSLR